MSLRIVFMGSPDFAVPSLEALVGSRHQVIAVVSAEDKRRGRGGELVPTAVKAKALALGIPVVDWPVFKKAAASDEGLAGLGQPFDAPIDLFVVVAFKILSPLLLSMPRWGSLNIHASLLPAYRGAAPIQRALMDGVTQTGCTIFKLDEGVDTGQWLAQESLSVSENETAGELYDRLQRLGAGMLLKVLDAVESGSLTLVSQDATLASYAPKLTPEDLVIDLHREARQVHNHIRALSPKPGAWMMYQGQRLRVYRTRVAPEHQPGLGQFIHVNDQHFVGCASGSIELLEVQLEGKRRMTAEEFFRGRR
jgi:methionyl-tRNA formyltransferase